MSKEVEEEIEKAEFLPGFETVQGFSADGFKRVITGVKAFQGLPQPGPSWDLHKSYPEFSRSMKNARAKIIPLMASLLKHVNIPTSDFRSRDVDEKFEFLVDSNDDMLERIGSSLDEAEGLFKKSEIVVIDKGIASSSLKAPGTWGKRKLDNVNAASDNHQPAPSQNINSANRPLKKALFRLRVTEKPQLKFSQPIDNSIAPFVPKLKEKPHSLKPLSILPEYTAKNEEFYGHPYAVELNKWEPHDDRLSKKTPEPPKDPKDTPVVYVSTPRDMERMVLELLDKKEIAVDLEHHSYRTYLGLTCLIQISSRQKDYVVDTLALRDQLGSLNEIFADPKVLKVFHGGSNDLDWLQRDFGIYVVNMFDTYIAAKVLGLPQQSLQYLLGKYCEIAQNKSLQLADWRIRPLPDEMLEYSRLDTHYLLYIYELMRNELIDSGNQHNNLLISVYDQSKQVCLKRYEKPTSNAQLALRKTRRSLNNRQLHAFTEMHKWRDETAREKDESLGYVLPNHMMLTIAESLPKEMNGILACCDPVPPLIHSNIGKIHKIITTARELPLHKVSVQTDKVEKKAKLKNWVVVLNSLHDVTPIESSEILKSQNVTAIEEFAVEDSTAFSKTDTWPQPWNDPGNWEQYVQQSNSPSLKFGKASVIRRLHHVGVETDRDLSTPFGRYEVSKKILDMLNDPKRQEEVDMDDPLVKAVYEAVLIKDTDAANNESTQEPEPAELSRVLDDGEFIPFNPLAAGSKKRRKKNEKYDAWNDGKQVMASNDGTAVELTLGESKESRAVDMIEDAEESSQSLMKDMGSKKNRKRKGKGKFLNKLKNAFGKGKGQRGNEDTSRNVKEEIEIVETKQESKQDLSRHNSDVSTPPSKRMKYGDEHSSRKQNFSGNHKRWKDDRGPNKSSPHSRSNVKRPTNPKNKTGIFKAWKKDNRSITFK